MKSLKTICTLLSAVVLSACVSPPPLQTARPKHANPQEIELKHSALLDQSKHLNADKNIVYFQTHGGGGVGVGLLLGPFGVMANAAMISSQTDEDIAAMKNKIALNPVAIFTEAAKTDALQIKTDANTANTKASPYLYIVKSDTDTLLVASALLVEQPGASGKWNGKYMVQLPITTSVDELSKNSVEMSKKIEALARNGFAEIIKTMKSETPENALSEKKIVFKSSFITPRFEAELPGSLMKEDKDLAWVRAHDGIYALNKKNISYTISQ